ncbi:MAG: glycoside hydrolase family 3 N-terminal domain-containing protein [Bdellovibrionales bacterium]
MFVLKSDLEKIVRPREGSRPLPVAFGCSWTELTVAERRFFADVNPFGFILFRRNCESPDQVRWLVRELRATVNRADAPVFIDQEGGRVARLQPPRWSKQPAARLFGQIYQEDPDWALEALQISTRIAAHELADLGITANCAPVVDLLFDDGTAALGDRCYGGKPEMVAALARVAAETMLKCGVLPVLKHFPGHGRMRLDPHKTLPTITASRAELEGEDFVPFELLRDIPCGMTSHAVYEALDSNKPASLSTTIHQEIIRGALGFDGLLLSDDLAMKAIIGVLDNLALRAIEAGTDVVLHCSGNMDEMRLVASRLPVMSDPSWARWLRAKEMVSAVDQGYDSADDIARLDTLLGGFAGAVATGMGRDPTEAV